MKKLLRHSWKEVPGKYFPFQCEKCGCVRYWDWDYNHRMYSWGNNITYKAPECKLYTEKPYNPIEIQAVKK